MSVWIHTAIAHFATSIVASAAQRAQRGVVVVIWGGVQSIQRLDPAKNCDNRLDVMGDLLKFGNIFAGSDDQPRVKRNRRDSRVGGGRRNEASFFGANLEWEQLILGRGWWSARLVG